VTKQETTKLNVNKLIEFRQAIYENGILARRDALFDLLDALISEGSVSSFAMLSQSSQFQRKWPSLYAAIEDGESTANGCAPIWPSKYRKRASASSRSMAPRDPDQDPGCWMTANMCTRPAAM